MRQHYQMPDIYLSKYGLIYRCNHKIYSKCTLYLVGDKGLAVIQQRYDPASKHTWWSEIDPYLVDELYTHTNFKQYFDERSGVCVNGLYPTVTIRQIMWGLRMKPLVRNIWETYFDQKTF